MASPKPKRLTQGLLLFLLPVVALAGCLGDDSSGTDGSGDPDGGGDVGLPDADNNSTGPVTEPITEPAAEPEPIVFSGTVTGLVDCVLISEPIEEPLTPAVHALPPEAGGRDFTLTATGPAGTPYQGSLCVQFDDRAPILSDASDAGEVPAGAQQVRIAATFAVQGSYVLTIE